MLQINQIENSKRLLQTGQYQLKQSKGREDVWLMAYLLSKNYEKEDIRKVWIKIYKTRHKEQNRDEIGAAFEGFYRSARRWRLWEGKDIIIYQEEIDIINKTHVLPWIKEYALMCLGYFKSLGRDKQNLGLFPGPDLRRMTSCKRVQGNINENARCCAAGLLHIMQQIKCSYMTGAEYETIDIKVPFLKNKGKEIFRTNTLMDVPLAFKMLRNEGVCPECGNTFQITPKTKRQICYDCWRKKRKDRVKNLNNAMK